MQLCEQAKDGGSVTASTEAGGGYSNQENSSRVETFIQDKEEKQENRGRQEAPLHKWKPSHDREKAEAVCRQLHSADSWQGDTNKSAGCWFGQLWATGNIASKAKQNVSAEM